MVVAGLAPGVERGPLLVDAGVDAALDVLAPVVEIRVPDRLDPAGPMEPSPPGQPRTAVQSPASTQAAQPPRAPRELCALLHFHCLADFHPERLAAAVPRLAALRVARGLLEDWLRGRVAASEVAARLPEIFDWIAAHLRTAAGAADAPPQAAAATAGGAAGGLAAPAAAAAAGSAGAPGSSAGSALDLLLGSVDLPPELGAAALAALPLAELLAGALAAADAGDARRPGLPPVDLVIGELDRRLALQTVEICHAAPLRALEEAWRGVALIAGQMRAAPPGSVRLEVLPASRDELLDAFYSEVFTAEHAAPPEVPLSAVVLGYEFDRGAAEVELLRQCARLGQSLSVPFLAAVGSGFWGIRQAQLLANLPDLGRKLLGPEYAKWKGLRAEDSSLWLCLTANRFLARPAWEVEGATGAARRPLWASAAYALGAILARGFGAAGPQFPLVGPQDPACLAGVSPEPEARTDAAGAAVIEVALPDRRLLEISQAGIAPLAAADGVLFFAAVPALHAPPRAAAPVASLAYQLFAGGAAHVLERIGRELEAGLSAAEIGQRVSRRLLDFLAAAGEEPADDEVAIELEPDAQEPGRLRVMVRLRPHFQVSGGDVDLVLGSAVGC
jgi:type VI secretion system protein ImpC